MNFCTNCGAPLDGGAAFCTSCGSAVTQTVQSSVQQSSQPTYHAPEPPVYRAPEPPVYSSQNRPDPYQAPPSSSGIDTDKQASVALTFGILSLVGCMVFGLSGILFGIVALSLGTKGREFDARFAKGAVIMGILGIIFGSLKAFTEIVTFMTTGIWF